MTAYVWIDEPLAQYTIGKYERHMFSDRFFKHNNVLTLLGKFQCMTLIIIKMISNLMTDFISWNICNNNSTLDASMWVRITVKIAILFITCIYFLKYYTSRLIFSLSSRLGAFSFVSLKSPWIWSCWRLAILLRKFYCLQDADLTRADLKSYQYIKYSNRNKSTIIAIVP